MVVCGKMSFIILLDYAYQTIAQAHAFRHLTILSMYISEGHP